jgi:hypothetical protein
VAFERVEQFAQIFSYAANWSWIRIPGVVVIKSPLLTVTNLFNQANCKYAFEDRFVKWVTIVLISDAYAVVGSVPGAATFPNAIPLLLRIEFNLVYHETRSLLSIG